MDFHEGKVYKQCECLQNKLAWVVNSKAIAGYSYTRRRLGDI